MRFLSLHGHFYQPPRSDPATGEVPEEGSADPYNDWNERITAECYRPNAERGNFERISYDVGPTLAAWLEREEPEVLGRIVASDAAGAERDDMGPPALAQPFHHTILPLATEREKEMEIAWGVAEFRHRYGREPRGMWLPETAADAATLDVLARRGIELTILAPWQVEGKKGEATPPHGRVELAEGRSLVVFPYHGRLSGRVSFDPRATSNAQAFAGELSEAWEAEMAEAEGEGRLLLLATDGELYGHHQKFRDLFLEELTARAAGEAGFIVTTPGRFLRSFPPRRTLDLRAPTSWSCHHGVERWIRPCPCTPGADWKEPLRAGLRRLAEGVDHLWESAAGNLLTDPWAVLEASVEVRLGNRSVEDLLREGAGQELSEDELRKLTELLRAQWLRHRMFASCGWFWSDFDRIEPRGNLAAAALAAVLVRRALGDDLSGDVREILQQAVSPGTGVTAGEIFGGFLDHYGE